MSPWRVRLGMGSSPRMRGKPPRVREHDYRSRLIPAHAGKTSEIVAVSYAGKAHPRACGENPQGKLIAEKSRGSSPRMRGKHLRIKGESPSLGLIPAHAGKTNSRRPAPGRVQAHPRACGENTERSGVLTLRSVRSWKTLSFPSSLKVTHCRAFVQLSLSRIRL